MNDFITAIGLVFVIEGLVYAAAPSVARRMAREAAQIPETTMRTIGIIVVCAGVLVVWLVRG